MKRTFILRFAMMALMALGCQAGMAHDGFDGIGMPGRHGADRHGR